MVKTTYIALLVLVCFALSAAEADREKSQPLKLPKVVPEKDFSDITGYYTCKGKEASGKTYNGIAVIVKKNDIYVVTWVIGGSSTFMGVGVRQGETFAASWVLPINEKTFIRGVNLYKIEPGPRLVGIWATLPGPGIHQRETLIFLRNLDKEED